MRAGQTVLHHLFGAGTASCSAAHPMAAHPKRQNAGGGLDGAVIISMGAGGGGPQRDAHRGRLVEHDLAGHHRRVLRRAMWFSLQLR